MIDEKLLRTVLVEGHPENTTDYAWGEPGGKHGVDGADTWKFID